MLRNILAAFRSKKKETSLAATEHEILDIFAEGDRRAAERKAAPQKPVEASPRRVETPADNTTAMIVATVLATSYYDGSGGDSGGDSGGSSGCGE